MGEGFNYQPEEGREINFKVKLSIEKEENAHQSLTLRSFFRQFLPDDVPKEYYDFLRGNITRDELFGLYQPEAIEAQKDAYKAELGKVPAELVDEKVRSALGNYKDKWVLVGGPPCQAYSLVGRSRNQGINPDDERVYLYREYYRLLAVHNPAVFIMENVKGLLSARVEKRKIFDQILIDLSDPVAAYEKLHGNQSVTFQCPGYRIFSLVRKPRYPSRTDGFDEPPLPENHRDFIIQAEKYGIPQTRHRVILLGIRKDIDTEIEPEILEEEEPVPISRILKDLPMLRSGLSRKDSAESWVNAVKQFDDRNLNHSNNNGLKEKLQHTIANLCEPGGDRGNEFIRYPVDVGYQKNWYLDKRLDGVCNHTTRGHIAADLHRYLFASCFAQVNNRSPKLEDFPLELLPNHKNINQNNRSNTKFADRFRVQLWDEPAKTITSHISKDGHYFIHPDSSQCRSFTVREAARIQTFPDNYFFCGGRTAQYVQVGNAVPPLLSYKISQIVAGIFKRILMT